MEANFPLGTLHPRRRFTRAPMPPGVVLLSDIATVESLGLSQQVSRRLETPVSAGMDYFAYQQETSYGRLSSWQSSVNWDSIMVVSTTHFNPGMLRVPSATLYTWPCIFSFHGDLLLWSSLPGPLLTALTWLPGCLKDGFVDWPAPHLVSWTLHNSKAVLS